MRHQPLATAATPCVLLACVSLTTGAGCLIPVPVAVFPAPEVGSGMEVSFHDGFGRLIDKDGLLIVHREYRTPINPDHVGVSNKVVSIIGGKTALPQQWNAASLWLMPNVYSYFLVPAPYVLPGDNLEIIPLLAGYSCRIATPAPLNVCENEEGSPAGIGHAAFSDGKAWLSESDKEPSRAIAYLESLPLRRLHQQSEPRGTDDGPHLCLPDEDYAKVRAFIQTEIERLRTIEQ